MTDQRKSEFSSIGLLNRSLWRKATFETLRRAFLYIAVRIEELKSRVKIALPSAYPYQPALISVAARITAQGP